LACNTKQSRPASPQSYRDLSERKRSYSSGVCVSSRCRYRDYRDKYYNSLVNAIGFLRHIGTFTALAFRRVTGIFGCFLTSCIFRRHQSEFGTQHLKNDIRKCCCPGKRVSPDTTRRIKGRRRFRYPKRSISCIQPPAHLVVSSVFGGTNSGAQPPT
jgi:hypothetical protein